MFNPKNLIFVDDKGLEFVRGTSPIILLSIGGILLLSYFLRSYSLWSIARRYGLKGNSFLLAFIPLFRGILLNRLGVNVLGYSKFKKFSVIFLYFIQLLSFFGILLLSINTSVYISVVIYIVVSYFRLLFTLKGVSVGLSGSDLGFLWSIGIIGSILALVSVSRTYTSVIAYKPKPVTINAYDVIEL